MQSTFSFLLLIAISLPLNAQQAWVDTLFQVQTTDSIVYGTAVDFAGTTRTLEMDITFPTNDTAPPCGRPLMVLVHGGAFLGGSKEDPGIQRMQAEFAKRGYVTAAVNYRLGMFHTDRAVNCNISQLGLEWNCLNMTDTAEWYRAYFRGIQDVNGAIRFLVNERATYQIDPTQIYVVGESAGGFIALGVAHIDDPAEVRQNLTAALPDAPAPNPMYESDCIQGYRLATSIAAMSLSRPDLGSYRGALNFPADVAYRIQGAGNFFGGAFDNIFVHPDSTAPLTYLFHQPNDLIVPYDRNRIFAGYNFCASQFPANCGNIINRPHSLGSKGIVNVIQRTASPFSPPFVFDTTTNNANCAFQILNPALQGHAIDNFTLRTRNLALAFAPRIRCATVSHDPGSPKARFWIRPNPADVDLPVEVTGSFAAGDRVALLDAHGRKIWEQELPQPTTTYPIRLTKLPPPSGIYLLLVRTQTGIFAEKLWVK